LTGLFGQSGGSGAADSAGEAGGISASGAADDTAGLVFLDGVEQVHGLLIAGLRFDRQAVVDLEAQQQPADAVEQAVAVADVEPRAQILAGLKLARVLGRRLQTQLVEPDRLADAL